MKLNMDCVRDILLCIEGNTGLRKMCFFIDSGLSDIARWTGETADPPAYQAALLQKYDNDTLVYHIHYCLDADLATARDGNNSYKIWICDLTVSGHELLAKIRDIEQWGIVKKGLSAVRDYSLSAISAVAEGATSAAISTYFSGKS